jgi:hypothetical protein
MSKSAAQLIVEQLPPQVFTPPVVKPQPPRAQTTAERIAYLTGQTVGRQKYLNDLKSTYQGILARCKELQELDTAARGRLAVLLSKIPVQPGFKLNPKSDIGVAIDRAKEDLGDIQAHLKEATRWKGVREKQIAETEKLLSEVPSEYWQELNELVATEKKLAAVIGGSVRSPGEYRINHRTELGEGKL